jgi:Flp pilus assembly pilin Flp
MTSAPVAKLRTKIAARRRDQKGATTAEYAVVTAAAAGFGGILFTFLKSDWAKALLEQIFSLILSAIGIG